MWWRRLRKTRLLVNLDNGSAVEGVLLRQRGPLLFLVDARLHEPGRDPVRLDGEVVIERPRVLFTQAIPPTPIGG